MDIGVAAHITAASPGGPRFDASLPSEERSSVANGLWLCQTHAKEIDDDQEHFSTALLRSWKEHAEVTARSMLGRPISGQPLDVVVEVSLQRDDANGLRLVGSSNLPTGTKLMVDLQGYSSDVILGQDKTTVFDRFFTTGGFSDGADPHPQDWFRVTVYSYFTPPWAQPIPVLEIVGRDGAHITGPHATLTDPDVEDSDIQLRAVFECLAPPLRGYKSPGEDWSRSAIDSLKGATFTVTGMSPPRSARPVAGVVDFFLGAGAIKVRDGWKATETVPGMVEVRFSCFDGDRPAEAVWHVIPSASSARYRNKLAKLLSWVSAD